MFVSLLLSGVAAASPAPHALPTAAAATPVAPATLRRDTEEISIETRDRKTLQGTFYLPRKRGSLSPGALLVHDAGGTREQVQELAERLQRLGFAVLAIDLRAHGASTADESAWQSLSPEAAAATWAYASRDVEAACQWLSRHSQVHATNLSLVGLRAGSSLAVRQAARDQNIMAVVLVAPQKRQFGFNLEQEIEDLEGLPTCILAKRDDAQAAEALSKRGNSLGAPFIEIIKTRGKSEELDRSEAYDIARWLQDRAMPKK